MNNNGKSLIELMKSLKSKLSDLDFSNMMNFLDDYANRQASGDCVKLIVCSGNDFFVETSPSLSDIDFKKGDLASVRELHKDCFTYLLSFDASESSRNFNLLECNRVLTVYTKDGVDLYEYIV